MRLRSWLLDTLRRPGAITRISTDFGCGVGIAVLASFRHSATEVGQWFVLLLVVGGAVVLVAYYARQVLARLLRGLTRLLALRRGSAYGLGAAVLTGLLVGWLVWMAGPGVPGRGAGVGAVLPALILALAGGWACVLTHRRVRGSRRRWVRHVPDVLAAVAVGLVLVVLFSRDPVAAGPVAGLLFPLGGWAAVRTWRAMTGSRRLVVRAAADIVFSLLLGADLVLLMVWGANLLDLPRAEVAAVRGTLQRAGSVAELPWWLWTVLYLLLAAVSLALALRPTWHAALPGWLRRLPVVPSIEAVRRALSGVHIGLLVTVLIAATAPAALAPTLHDQIEAQYAVALQKEFESEGEQAAYEEIRREFTQTGNLPPQARPPLTGIVSKIHQISPPRPGTQDATSTERSIAQRIGRLQAVTLRVDAAPTVLSTRAAVVVLAMPDRPTPDEGDLHERLDRLETQQQRADTVTRQVEGAADLAAIAVANALQVLDLGQTEVVQIVKEYLQGLVEGSRLKEVFFAWGRRLTGATSPPATQDIVVPDPRRLLIAAFGTLVEVRSNVRFADPFSPDPVWQRALRESPADAVVDLVNEARYFDEGSGPCQGCPRPLRPGEEPHLGPGRREVPYEHPPERPRIPIR